MTEKLWVWFRELRPIERLAKKLRFSWVLTGAVLAAVLIWAAVFSLPDKSFYLRFYDVGQGDAIFIKTPNNRKILIDGGPDEQVLSYLGRDLPFWDRKIDLVISTHPHADHLTGLLAVAKRYRIGMVAQANVTHTSGEYAAWLKLLLDEHLPVLEIIAGEKIKTGDGVVLEFLWPSLARPSPSSARWPGSSSGLELNDLSAVIRLSFGNFSALFPGDKSLGSLSSLNSLNTPNSLTVLKVPHHGSKTALSAEFLASVRPESAVVSVGKNSFGHPAKETLEKLKDSGAKIFRTDERGTITLVSDGKTWFFSTER